MRYQTALIADTILLFSSDLVDNGVHNSDLAELGQTLFQKIVSTDYFYYKMFKKQISLLKIKQFWTQNESNAYILTAKTVYQLGACAVF